MRPVKRTLTVTSFLSALAVCGLMSGSALAGFEFIAPKEDMSQDVPAVTAIPGQKPVMIPMAPLPPLTIGGDDPVPSGTVYDEPASAVAPAPRQAYTAPSVAEAANNNPQALLQVRRMGLPSEYPEMQASQRPQPYQRMSETIADEPFVQSGPQMLKREPLSAPVSSEQPQQLKMSETLIVPPEYSDSKPETLELPPESMLNAPVQTQSAGGAGRVHIDPHPAASRPAEAPSLFQAPAAPPAAEISRPARIVQPPAEEAAIAADLNDGNIVGFGSDIPLVMALQQVVPPEYSYSFASGVNPALEVSWNGGKPWYYVLNDMLQPNQLHATIKGKTIHIQRASADRRAAAFNTQEPAAGTEPAPVMPAVSPAEPSGAAPVAAPVDIQASIIQSRYSSVPVEQIVETRTIHGSDEEKEKAREAVLQKPLTDTSSETQPSVKITSYKVTTTTQKPAPDQIQKRSHITDPGEYQAESAAQGNAPEKTPALTLSNSRLSIEDMARMQGVELDSASAGKVENGG